MKLEDLTVLYAEDEVGIQQTVSEVLELYVNQVVCASNGQEALELYRQYNPSILLLDICMPEKDGLEFLKQIRQKDLKTPAVMMTAHTENEYLMNAVELHITKYLVKPFDKKSLLEALEECVRYINQDFDEVLNLGEGFTYWFEKGELIKDGEVIHLNKKERQLLSLCLQNRGKTLTYEEIEYHIWEDVISREALKSLIKDLRKKTYKSLIKNISGVGYKVEIE